MSSLLPIITEILPMILPSTTEVTHADQLTPILDNEGRSIRDAAIVGKCDKMCASGESSLALNEACQELRCNSSPLPLCIGQSSAYPPSLVLQSTITASKVGCHIPASGAPSISPKNGLVGWLGSVSDNAQDAIINAVSGIGTLVVKEGFKGELRHHELKPGDFAFVPAWTEHQVRNDTDQDLVWVITQSGPRPVGAILTDWGGQEAKTIE